MSGRALVVLAVLAATAYADDPPPAEATELVIEYSLWDTAHTPHVTTDASAEHERLRRVLVDDLEVQPFTPVAVTPGTHHVYVGVEGYEPVLVDANAVAGASVHVAVKLVARPLRILVLAPSAPRRAVPWVAGGAGVLALTSVGTLIGALVAQGNAETIRGTLGAGNVTPAQRDAYNSDVHARDDLRAAALATGAGSLVALGVAAALYWFALPLKHAGFVPVGTTGMGWQSHF